MWKHVKKETYCSKVEIIIVNSGPEYSALVSNCELCQYKLFIQPAAVSIAVLQTFKITKSPIEILI